MPPTGRGRASSVPLAPPWAPAALVTAFLAGSLLAALVWHATRLDPVDAWVMRWQVPASDRAGGLAAIVAATVTPALLATVVAGAALGWLVGRWDLAVLALAAPLITLAAEILLKRLVHRQWEGGPALLFPSGHVAVATAMALTAVLAARVTPASPRTRLVVTWLAGGYVLAIAVARLVETVHSLTDLLGGGATGLVVTLGTALAVTAGDRHLPRRAGCVGRRRSSSMTRPPPGAGHNRS
jgi:membrane-associated phospholipid phosphatase